ncbi:MAG TPA: hypothetical protein VES88_17650 [Gemmatimonadaceae bacterium]|nr:hypothetical protein [Gemmatimonadaceae bacterium]
MTRPEIGGISPFFIVHDATAALSFYRDQLGFEITFQGLRRVRGRRRSMLCVGTATVHRR